MYQRRYHCDDPFWDDGNVAAAVSHKLTALDAAPLPSDGAMLGDDDDELCSFRCNQPGCFERFDNLRDYEAHNGYAHAHRCETCSAAFPSERLLDMHLSETHDAFFQAMARRQPMYACLVEGCAERCKTSRARRKHLVRVHSYPRSFRFHRRRGAAARGQRNAAGGPASGGPAADGPASGGPAAAGASPRKQQRPAAAAAASGAPKVRACRFTATERGCGRGDACRFSHDPALVAAAALKARKCRSRGSRGPGRGGAAAPPVAAATAGEDEDEMDVSVDDVLDSLGSMRIGAVPTTLSFGRRGRRRR